MPRHSGPSRARRVSALVTAVLCVFATPGGAHASERRTVIVSLDTGGAAALLPSGGPEVAPALSSDGRFVAFTSKAPLVADDTNARRDVYVRDVGTGRIERVSLNQLGAEGADPCTVDCGSWWSAISADGRFVSFHSTARLVTTDTDDGRDVYVRDRVLQTTTRVSAPIAGQPDGESFEPSISGDGSRVGFTSAATNLVPGDTNTTDDVFVRDMNLGATTLVSVSTSGGPADDRSSAPAISADGSHVAFQSDATDIVEHDTNDETDVFVHGVNDGHTLRASLASARPDMPPIESNGASTQPSISHDGSVVAFESRASNLADSPDSPATYDVFVRQPATGTTVRVSLAQGAVSEAFSRRPALAADGGHLAFITSAPLASGDTNTCAGFADPGTCPDVVVASLATGAIELASLTSAGLASNGESFWPAITPDGSVVAFSSEASNLDDLDTNIVTDVFRTVTGATCDSGVSERGPVSRPVHEIAEPAAGPLGPPLHDANCAGAAALGL